MQAVELLLIFHQLPTCKNFRRYRMKRLFPALLISGMALLMGAAPLSASAQFAKPEDAIKYRKAAFTMLGSHFGRVAAMANGKIPFDAKLAAENAEIANMLSKLPFTAFVPGSEKGHNTDVKPQLWAEMDKFKEGATKMQDALAKLQEATKGGPRATFSSNTQPQHTRR
jgi:cytochrome c556